MAVKYLVFRADNSHVMTEEKKIVYAEFYDYRTAVDFCKKVITESICSLGIYDDSQDAFFSRYMMFGESAWITPEPQENPFRPIDFAREKILELYRDKEFWIEGFICWQKIFVELKMP